MDRIYEYAVLMHPTEDERKAGTKRSSIVIPPTTVLASDDDEAQILVGRAIPEEHLDHLDRIEVAIRPF